MRRGAIINKKRVIDTCIAKGNDTRNVGLAFPVFDSAQTSAQSAGFPTIFDGELLLRSAIIQSGNILNSRIQLQNPVSPFVKIGDNQQRNYYPAGLLELHQRVHKTQVKNIKSIDFYPNTHITTSYATDYIDISDYKELIFIRVGLALVTYFNCSKNLKLKVIHIRNNNLTNVNIQDNTSLVIFNVAHESASGNINSLTLASSYNNLLTFSINNNKFTSFPALVAPNLTSLSTSFNPTLGNIPFSDFPNLETLNAARCGLTQLDLSNNTFLKTIDIGINQSGNNNNLTNQANISNCLLLETLNAVSCGLTALDVSNNTELITLNIRTYYGQVASKNNFGTNLVGLYNLVKLKVLDIDSANVTMTNFDLEVFPELVSLLAANNPNLTGNLLTTTDKTFLTNIDVSVTGITFLNTNHTPNLGRLILTRFNQIDFTVLTKLYQLQYDSTSSGTLTVVDLRNGTLPMNVLRVFSNIIITTLYLPPTQVTTFSCYNCANLSTFVINNISRTNTSLFINNLALATLDTSFGAINCFPNLTELAVGGTNDTYTSTKVFDDRKNNLITLVVLGTHFQVNGNLGTDTLTSATLINVEGDSNLSYTGSGTFGATMRRVFLRPKTGSGLATDGNQVANLIIALSLKTWGASGNTNISGVNYTHRVIDLRGNCAVAIASGSLTTALNLLITKGVSVLRNT